MGCVFRVSDRLDDGRWVCRFCRRPSRTAKEKPPRRQCRLMVICQQPPCPFGPIVQRLTPEGLARLDRCRAANCGMMHKVNGAITCVGMQGKKCGWQTKWIRCLNREEEFGCGGYECPHWLNANDHAEQHQQANQHDDGTSATHCVVAEFME